MQEVYVRSLDREDPLEEGMATHSSTLARIIPWMEKPGGLQSIGSQRVRHDSACICSQVKSSQSHSVVSNSYDPMDCSPQGSSVHGILQARILEWVDISFSQGSSPGIKPGSPTLQADSLPSELPGKWRVNMWVNKEINVELIWNNQRKNTHINKYHNFIITICSGRLIAHSI